MEYSAGSKEAPRIPSSSPAYQGVVFSGELVGNELGSRGRSNLNSVSPTGRTAVTDLNPLSRGFDPQGQPALQLWTPVPADNLWVFDLCSDGRIRRRSPFSSAFTYPAGQHCWATQSTSILRNGHRLLLAGAGALSISFHKKSAQHGSEGLQIGDDISDSSKVILCFHYRSPGHHVDGGSLAEIFVCRGATRWLRLYR
jgi:hypothetical protein